MVTRSKAVLAEFRALRASVLRLYEESGATDLGDVRRFNETIDEALTVSMREFAPRDWSEHEIGLLEQTAERTWAAVERAHAEAALRNSRERLRRALSIPRVCGLFFRLDGRILEANAALEQMVGYTLQELRAMTNWSVLTPPEFQEGAARDLAAQGRTTAYEKNGFAKDGSRMWGLFAPTCPADVGRGRTDLHGWRRVRWRWGEVVGADIPKRGGRDASCAGGTRAAQENRGRRSAIGRLGVDLTSDCRAAQSRIRGSRTPERRRHAQGRFHEPVAGDELRSFAQAGRAG